MKPKSYVYNMVDGTTKIMGSAGGVQTRIQHQIVALVAEAGLDSVDDIPDYHGDHELIPVPADMTPKAFAMDKYGISERGYLEINDEILPISEAIVAGIVPVNVYDVDAPGRRDHWWNMCIDLGDGKLGWFDKSSSCLISFSGVLEVRSTEWRKKIVSFK